MLLCDVPLVRLLAVVVAVSSLCCPPVLAQNAPEKTGKAAKPVSEKRSLLDLLRYDPKRLGPLLCVAQDRFPMEYDTGSEKYVKEIAEKKTPAQFADAVGARALAVGDITAIVPRTMSEIVKNPGKPDIYAGMSFEKRLVVVMATFTREQWKQAGSGNGIGLGELTDNQRTHLTSLWRGEAAKIRSMRVGEDGIPSGWDEVGSVAIPEMRLRLSRRVSLRLQPAGSGDGFTHRPTYSPGDVQTEGESDGEYTRQILEMPTESRDAAEGVVSAFGVPVIKAVPNRLKTGQLSLDTPALSVGVRLDGSHKTVGELLAAVAKTTRLPLTADKRLAALSVGYRLKEGGHVVSASNVLKAVCRSVTGTFRRLDGLNGATIYLLTDDVEGIGTRFARLDRWAEKANRLRREADWQAIGNCAENEPLDSLGFAPGYPFALSGDQIKTIDDHYRTGKWDRDMTVPVSELPTALREEFRIGTESIRKWKPDAALRTDRVGVETEFHCDWIVPGGRAFPALGFESALSLDFLRQVAVSPSERAARRKFSRDKNPPPAKLSPALKRRILTTTLPGTTDETKALFALLSPKGFNEAWLRVEHGDAATRERLGAALVLGRRAKIRVGVVIPWLMKEEAATGATVDVNIIGETGTELLTAHLSNISDKQLAAKERTRLADRDAGWVVPDARSVQSIVDRVSPFLKMTGLSAVAFTNAVPLGYADTEPGIAYHAGTFMGYDKQLRFRCVREEGFDPVDVAERALNLDISEQLPFFRPYGIGEDLARFRRAENKAQLSRIYAALRKDFPAHSFYLDDGGNRMFKFYGRWGRPEGFPAIGERTDGDAKRLRGVAFRTDPTPLFALRGTRLEYADSFFWEGWRTGNSEAGKGWGAFVLDMPTESSEDVTALLKKLPDDTPPLPIK